MVEGEDTATVERLVGQITVVVEAELT